MASPLFRPTPPCLCSGLDLVPAGPPGTLELLFGLDGLSRWLLLPGAGRREESGVRGDATRLPALGSPDQEEQRVLLSKKENCMEINLINTQPQLGLFVPPSLPAVLILLRCQATRVPLIVNVSVRLERKINKIN